MRGHFRCYPFLNLLVKPIRIDVESRFDDDICPGELGGLFFGVDAYDGCIGDRRVGEEDIFKFGWSDCFCQSSTLPYHYTRPQ